MGQPTAVEDLAAELRQGQEDWAFSIGVQAYIWGYPIVECWKDRLKKLGGEAAAVNRFRHVRALATPQASEFVNAATDFLYSTAVIDLAAGPLLLRAPDFGARWYVLQLLDPYMETIENLGTRSSGGQLPRVLLARAGTVDPPQGARLIECSSDHLYIVARIAADPAESLVPVHALQDALQLQPLQAPRAAAGRAYAPLEVAGDGTAELAFFRELAAVIRHVPPRPEEGMLTALLAEVGIAAARDFDEQRLPEGVRRGLARAMPFAEGILQRKLFEVGRLVNGWGLVTDIGRYGGQYIIRALVARHGIWANVPEESLYFMARSDHQGQRLHGRHRYEIRFPRQGTPPVDAFWSISYYDEHGRLVANPLERYTLHSRYSALSPNPDGSLSIFIGGEAGSAQRPSNWLPSHDGFFTLNLRCYNPRAPLLDLSYEVPPIVRLD